MNRQEAKQFFADKDVVDSLKLEASPLEPKLERGIISIVPEFVQSVVNTYEMYIPSETLERVKTLPERVLVMEREAFDTMFADWYTDPDIEGDDDPEKHDGVHLFTGNLVLVRDPQSLEYVWDKFSDSSKERWIERYGSEPKAREAVGAERFGSVLLHEIIHDFHPKHLPLNLAFIEHGVSYYTEKLSKQIGIVPFSNTDHMRAEAYRSFIRRYGNIVHKVFFGATKSETMLHNLSEAYKRHLLEIVRKERDNASDHE